MSEMLDVDALSTPAVIKAMEANFTRFFTIIFASEGFQYDPEATYEVVTYASGVPFPIYNGVMLAKFSEEEADRKIAETMEYFKSRDLPISWFISPSSTPANQAERLLAQGLVPLEEDTGMEADLTTLPDEDAPIPGLEIRRVEDEAALKVFSSIFLKGYGLPDFLEEATYNAFKRVGFDPNADFQNFLGYLDGTPVASSTVFCSDGLAGIFDIATLEEARGRGIGRAMTRVAMLRGRDKGYKVAVLEATLMGYNIYHKLGFTDNCKIGQYMWMKEEAAVDFINTLLT